MLLSHRTPLSPVLTLTLRAWSRLRAFVTSRSSVPAASRPGDMANLQRHECLSLLQETLALSITPQDLAAHLNAPVRLHLDAIGEVSVLCRRLHPTEGRFKFSLPVQRNVDGFLLCCIDEEAQALHLLVVPRVSGHHYLRLSPQDAREQALWSVPLRQGL